MLESYARGGVWKEVSDPFPATGDVSKASPVSIVGTSVGTGRE